MNVTLFIALLTMFSTITGVVTEGCKKLLNEAAVSYSSNILAFIVACIVGVSGTAVYYILNSIEFNIVNIICMFLMGLATSVGAMVGYDKVVQTITHLKK
jgi:hypothetical protein